VAEAPAAEAPAATEEKKRPVRAAKPKAAKDDVDAL
jgi:hypothetical protein